MKFQEWQYLDLELFADEKGSVQQPRCATKKIVKVRKPHNCDFGDLLGKPTHQIEKGEFARFDKDLYENKWCSWYSCLPCIDQWLLEIGETPIHKGVKFPIHKEET